MRARLEHDPRKKHGLTAFELDLPREGHPHFHLQVIANTFPEFQGAVLAPNPTRFKSQPSVGLYVSPRYWQDESINVEHEYSAIGQPCLLKNISSKTFISSLFRLFL